MGRGTGSYRGYRFRADLRHRRGAWLGVAAVVGLSAGLVLALVAGARRSDTAIDRFVAESGAHDLMVINGIPGTFDFAEVDLDEVAALPGVADSQRADVLAASGRTEAGLLIDTTTVNFLADPSGRIGGEFSAFKYLEGRPADPDEPNEVVATFRTAESFDLEVGSTIETNFLDEEELGRLFTPVDQGGTTFDALADVPPFELLRVVGIAVDPGGLAPPAGDDTTTLWMTPAATEAYAGSAVIEVLLVDLEDGAAGESAFLERLQVLGGGQPVLTVSTAEDAGQAGRTVTPIVQALYLAAALVAVVTLLVAGQVLARQAAAEAADDPTLRALGWTRVDLVGLRVAKAMVMGVVAGFVAAGVGLAFSPLFPLGLAGIAEPDTGVDLDGLVLVGGAVAVAVAASLLAALTGWWEVGRGRPEWRARRPSRVLSLLTAAGASPPVVTGTGLAVQAGPRGSPPPVLTAGTTMALGLVTVVAVLVFMASLGHLTETPRLFGWAWDVELGQEFSSRLTRADVAVIRDDPDVVAVAIGTATALDLDGQRVEAFAVDDVLGRIEPSLLAGRRAEAVGEVVVSPELGDIGTTVPARFGEEETELHIVGHAALPRADALLTFETLQVLAPRTARQTALVDLREGADTAAFVERIRVSLAFTGQDVQLPELPDDLVNFGRVDSAPAVVAGTMALVAAATLIHALITTVRRRRRDLALLRTLGFTRRQVLTTVAWQATVLVGCAGLVALPLGVVVGRWAWSIFAESLRVVGEPVVPAAALGCAVLAALVLAGVVAVATGRWSARGSTSSALRAE